MEVKSQLLGTRANPIELPPINVTANKPAETASLTGVQDSVDRLASEKGKILDANQAQRIKSAKLGIAKDVFGVGLSLASARDTRREGFRAREAQDNIFQQQISFQNKVSDAEFRQSQSEIDAASTLQAIQDFTASRGAESLALSGVQVQDTSGAN